MPRRSSLLLFIFCLISLALLAPRAQAMIQVKSSVSSTYTTSKAVWLGKIEAVDKPLFTVRITESFTGNAPAAGRDLLKMVVVQPPDLAERVAVGEPVVIFVSKVAGKAAMHVGDMWVLASEIADTPGRWQTVQDLRDKDQTKGYPGRTDALVRIVKELAAQPAATAPSTQPTKYSLLDAVDNKVLLGGFTPAGKLDAKPTAVLAADLNGDKRTDLIIRTADGLRFLISDGKTFQDQTAQYRDAAAKITADPTVADWLATGKPAQMTVTDGKLECREVDGKTPPADYFRLTGQHPGDAVAANKDGFKNPVTALLDVNGDGRKDFLIVAQSGAELLINRGFGTFMVVPEVNDLLGPNAKTKPPFDLAGAVMAGADVSAAGVDDLVVITAKGEIFILWHTPKK